MRRLRRFAAVAFLGLGAILPPSTTAAPSAPNGPADTDSVIVASPIDGGSPRRPSNLVRLSANRYRLTPENKEIRQHGVVTNVPALEGIVMVDWQAGSLKRYDVNGLTHAAFKPSGKAIIGFFTVEATNRSDKPQTVAIDLEGVINHYCYYRPPTGEWRRADIGNGGKTLELRVPPGCTRISEVPWYTYGEYLAWIDSLQDRRVTKEVAYTFDKGQFKVYRLTITNPGGVKDKLKLAFTRTPHAHETSGYYMAQGMVEWLLSDDPAANLDRVVWIIYPDPTTKNLYYNLQYNELERGPCDSGKTCRETWMAGIKALSPHVIQCVDMWNGEGGYCDKFEAYAYWDPLGPDFTAVYGYGPTYPFYESDSPVYRDWVAYRPHWFEWGGDYYYHGNAVHKPGENYKPSPWVVDEIPFYGKDTDGDVAANMRRHGKELARAMSQVYLRFQQQQHFWTGSHPSGPVDATGAVLLPRPVHTLLETLEPFLGAAQSRKNGNGQKMVIFHKAYAHGLGMKAGQYVTYTISSGANAFRASAALDDAEPNAEASAKFVVKVDGKELWRSRTLKRYDSQMAHVKLPGCGHLTLSVEGADGVLGNWGGAKFILHDPDMTAAPRGP